MAKTIIKDVHINLPKKELLESFIETLSEALKHVEFTLTYKQGNLKVRLFGDREEIAQSMIIVKTYVKMFIQSSIPNDEGYYTHNLKLIQQIGSKIISLENISTTLKYSGKQSSVKGYDLISKASMQEVQSVLTQLYNLIQETPLNVRTQTMKRVLSTISYCTDLSPSFVLEKGLELDYFKHEKNTISINYEPEKCIRDLIVNLSEGDVKPEFQEFIKNEEINNRKFFKE